MCICRRALLTHTRKNSTQANSGLSGAPSESPVSTRDVTLRIELLRRGEFSPRIRAVTEISKRSTFSLLLASNGVEFGHTGIPKNFRMQGTGWAAGDLASLVTAPA